MRLSLGASVLLWMMGAAGITASVVEAQVEPDTPGQVATLPETVGEHWVWVPDRALRRTVLFDGSTGKMLGLIDSGMTITPKAPQWSRARHEIYAVDTIYTRGHHGERKDYVFVYDARTLNIVDEIEIPPRTADTGTGIALVGMLDQDRFLVVLNQSPGTSVSVVDLAERRFVGEVQTAGCAGVYPVGPGRFGMLCGNGTAITVMLSEQGELERITRSKPFFDAVSQPVSEKGVRDGTRWIHTSFDGHVYEVDYAGEVPHVSSPWSLFTASERQDDWRVGGGQYLAYHRATGRLFSIVHRGGPGSHKDAGTEVWVYDAQAKKRVARFSMPNVLVAFLRPQAGIEAGSFANWLLDALLPNEGVHSIAVTQDEKPLLFARHADLGAVGVLDATDGTHLRDLEEVGLSGVLLVVP